MLFMRWISMEIDIGHTDLSVIYAILKGIKCLDCKPPFSVPLIVKDFFDQGMAISWLCPYHAMKFVVPTPKSIRLQKSFHVRLPQSILGWSTDLHE